MGKLRLAAGAGRREAGRGNNQLASFRTRNVTDVSSTNQRVAGGACGHERTSLCVEFPVFALEQGISGETIHFSVR